ncbi:MAG: S-layer homology domain-containing protein [bacterium]
MKYLKSALSILMAVLLLVTCFPLDILADAVKTTVKDGYTVVQNDFIKVSVNNKTGRFSITTTEGQPLRKNDQNSRLTFEGDDTSFTTFRINGTDYIFGNDYALDIAGWAFQSLSTPVVKEIVEHDPENGDVHTGNYTITSTWSVEGVAIDQIITVYKGDTTTGAYDNDRAGMVKVDYAVHNTTGASVDVKTRILLDTMVGINDGPAYQNGSNQTNPNQVEHVFYNTLYTIVERGAELPTGAVDSEGKPVTYKLQDAQDVANYTLQGYYLMRDAGSYLDPLSTNIYAYGYPLARESMNDSEVNRVVIGHWSHLANSKFDVDLNTHLDFTTDTNDYGSADTAVAYYWDHANEAETKILAGGTRHYSILYGLGEITTNKSAFIVSFPNQISSMQVNDAATAYQNDGLFDISVQIEVPEDGGYHDYLEVELTLDDGLSVVDIDEQGNVTSSSEGRVTKKTFVKTLTPAMIAAAEEDEKSDEVGSGNSNIRKFGPGDIQVATFHVRANGRPWPTTRQYIVEVSSPQTVAHLVEKSKEELAKMTAEERMAYEQELQASMGTILSDFIFLPAIGELKQTYSYALTPEECFYTDEKLISVGINNVEAYLPAERDADGKVTREANFTAYLVAESTGKKYQIPDNAVSRTVRDGASGLLNINYKGPVNKDVLSNLEPGLPACTLPIGEYRLQVVYRGTDDAEKNELLSFTSSQVIQVTSDQITRLRTGSFLTIAKRYHRITQQELKNYEENVLKTMGISEYEHQANYLPYYEVHIWETMEQIQEYERFINAAPAGVGKLTLKPGGTYSYIPSPSIWEEGTYEVKGGVLTLRDEKNNQFSSSGGKLTFKGTSKNSATYTYTVDTSKIGSVEYTIYPDGEAVAELTFKKDGSFTFLYPDRKKTETGQWWKNKENGEEILYLAVGEKIVASGAGENLTYYYSNTGYKMEYGLTFNVDRSKIGNSECTFSSLTQAEMEDAAEQAKLDPVNWQYFKPDNSPNGNDGFNNRNMTDDQLEAGYNKYGNDVFYNNTKTWDYGEILVTIKGMSKEQDGVFHVDTSAEPAIINSVLYYKGEDIVVNEYGNFFGKDERGQIGSFATLKEFYVLHITKQKELTGGSNQLYLLDDDSPEFYNTQCKLSDNITLGEVQLRGKGKLTTVSSGFEIYDGEYTLNFYDGFEKSGWRQYVGSYGGSEAEKTPIVPIPTVIRHVSDSPSTILQDFLNENKEHRMHNAMNLEYAMSEDYQFLLCEVDVYFNFLGTTVKRKFRSGKVDYRITEYVLASYQDLYLLRMSGDWNIVVFDAMVENLSYDALGEWAVDSTCGVNLFGNLGLLVPNHGQVPTRPRRWILNNAIKNGRGAEDTSLVGTISKTVSGIANAASYFSMRRYRDLNYDYYYAVIYANIPKVLPYHICVEIGLKTVPDGRLLPDVLAASFNFKWPGIEIPTGGLFHLYNAHFKITGLADTIAKSGKNGIPLTIMLGGSAKIGKTTLWLTAAADLTIKATGLKVNGTLDLTISHVFAEDTILVGGSNLEIISLPLITEALVEVQWAHPWFINIKATADILDLHILTGTARIFAGQTEEGFFFEGYACLAVYIPEFVPVVGTWPIAKAYLGVSTKKIWGGAGLAIGPLSFIVNISYPWGGGFDDISIWVDNDGRPEDDSYCYLLVTDEETGAQHLMGIGNNMKMLVSSYYNKGDDVQDITYRDFGGGVQLLEFRGNTIGTGGITVDYENGLWVHKVPIGMVNAQESGAYYDALAQVETYGENGLANMTAKIGDKSYALVESPEGDFTPAADTLYYVNHEQVDEDGAARHMAYIALTHDELAKYDENAILTLADAESFDTALISIEKTGTLKSVTATADDTGISASAVVNYAKAGDVVKFYLTKDKFEMNDDPDVAQPTMDELPESGIEIGEVVIDETNRGDKVINARFDFDSAYNCKDADGNNVNLQEILRSGTYYLRADFQTPSNYTTLSADEEIHLVDPKAPISGASKVTVKPAGNGYFEITFPKATLPTGVDGDVKYSILFKDQKGAEYPYFAELLVDESTEGVTDNGDGTMTALLGEWADMEIDKPRTDANGNYLDEAGNIVETEEEAYVETTTTKIGLEPGQYFQIEVAPVNVQNADTEDETYHYGITEVIGDTTAHGGVTTPDGGCGMLLPEPTPVKLIVKGATARTESGGIDRTGKNTAYYEYATNAEEVSFTVNADQACTLTVLNGEDNVVLTQELQKGDNTLNLTEYAEADGTTTLLLRTENAQGDVNTEVLYLTIDRQAPVLYISAPVFGEAIGEDGYLTVTGETTPGDSRIRVYVGEEDKVGTEISIAEDGTFNGRVRVSTTKATEKVRFEAFDAAGNSNAAAVDVTNPAYEVIQGIVLVEKLEPMKLNSSMKLETAYRTAEGVKDTEGNWVTDAEGNIQLSYTDTIFPDDAGVTYSIYKGAAVTVNGNTVTAVQNGASIVRATYEKDGNTFTALGVIRVGESGTTPDPTPTPTPTPTPGGDPTPGPDIGDIGETGDDSGLVPAEDSNTTVNGIPTDIIDKDNTVKIDASDKTGDVKVYSQRLADAYEVTYGKGTESLTLDLPIAKGTIDAAALDNAGTIRIAREKTLPAGVTADNAAAYSVKLGSKPFAENPQLLSLAVPDTLKVGDITGVTFYDEDGNASPIPFKVNVIGTHAFVDVLLPENGTVVIESRSSAFIDVTENMWSYASVNEAADRGYVQGVGGNRFDPKSNINRAAFATIMMRVAGKLTWDGRKSFPDNQPGTWYYAPVAIASDLGVLTGYPDGTVKPLGEVTRLEAMVMVGRVIRLFGISTELSEEEIDSILSDFSDGAAVAKWGRADAAVCVKYGIILGANGALNGTGKLTREQCAAIAIRLGDLIVRTQLG